MPFWKSKSARPKIGDLFWHLHGDGYGLIIERLREPLPNLITFIKATESKEFRETHLRLMKPVRGTLSPACEATFEAYDRAAMAYRVQQVIYHSANQVYERALATHLEAAKVHTRRWQTGSALMAAYQADKARESAHAARMAVLATQKETRDAWNSAWATGLKALEPHFPEILALHDLECPDCPLMATRGEPAV